MALNVQYLSENSDVNNDSEVAFQQPSIENFN